MDSARFSRHRARDGRDARRASGEISLPFIQGLQLLDKSQPRTGHTLTVVIIGQEETTTTERHIDGHTAVHPIRLPRQNSASTDSSHAGEKSDLGSRASGMQGSLDTGTAWPYYRPESRTLGTLEMSSRTR